MWKNTAAELHEIKIANTVSSKKKIRREVVTPVSSPPREVFHMKKTRPWGFSIEISHTLESNDNKGTPTCAHIKFPAAPRADHR